MYQSIINYNNNKKNYAMLRGGMITSNCSSEESQNIRLNRSSETNSLTIKTIFKRRIYATEEFIGEITFIYNGSPEMIGNLTLIEINNMIKQTPCFPHDFDHVNPSAEYSHGSHVKQISRPNLGFSNYNLGINSAITLKYVLYIGYLSFYDVRDLLYKTMFNLLHFTPESQHKHLVLFVPMAANGQIPLQYVSENDDNNAENIDIINKNIRQGIFLPFVLHAVNRGLQYTIILLDMDFTRGIQTYDYLHMTTNTELYRDENVIINKYENPTSVDAPYDTVITPDVMKKLQQCNFTVVTIKTRVNTDFDEKNKIYTQLFDTKFPPNVKFYFKFFGDDITYPILN